MTQVVFLPMDDRPVNYDYPGYLARAAGLQLSLPPREWLGNPWRSSRHAELVDWLVQAAPKADGVVVALDTLAYGGLIPSRTSDEAAETVLERLGALRRIKQLNPSLPILASSVVMRVNRSDSCEEEKPYCATYGRRLFQLSFLEHKTAEGEASPEEIARRDALRAEIPAEVYRDYRGGRARNHAVNRAMLDWAAEGVFDYLLLPQDDTADFGWNVAEARSLQARIRTLRLSERAITYPGADEVGCLLLARFACQRAGLHPRVWPRYSGITAPAVITAYEDRPIHELLKAHLGPLGGIIASSPQEADLTLFVNAPVKTQGNGDSQWLIQRGYEAVRAQMPAEFQPWLEQFFATDGFRATRREMQSPSHNPEELVRALQAAVGAGAPVALADLAYVNAADLLLGELLRQKPETVGLAAFGGWNTAGNTLGTVLAQALIRVLALRAGATREQLAAHLEFLFLRFFDDDLYQAHERTRCMVEDLPARGIAPSMERLPDDQLTAIEAGVRARLELATAQLRDLFVRSGLVRDVRVTKIHLPWRRLFEIGFDVKVELN